jgi:hypothetical protein
MSTSQPELSGRVAIVTGANHGIGAAIVTALAASGADVLITYLRIEDERAEGVPEQYRLARARGAEEVVSIERMGGRAFAVTDTGWVTPASRKPTRKPTTCSTWQRPRTWRGWFASSARTPRDSSRPT